MKHICFCLLIAWGTIAFAQTYSAKDYSKLDSISQHTKKKHRKVDELADVLTAGLTTPDEKARVIYSWIAYHIEYKEEKYGTDPEKILKRGYGVCEGYSALFDAMCARAGVPTSIVTGYSKTKTTEIGKKYVKPDHAWNAVYIDSTWFFVDATWGAGSYDHKEDEFIQSFEDAFFLALPGFFNLSHLPEDSMWVKIARDTSTVQEFYHGPLFYPAYDRFDHLLYNTQAGIIQVRGVDTIRVELNNYSKGDEFEYFIKSGKKIGPVNIVFEDGKYFMEIPFPKQVTTLLTILYKREPLFDIRLKNQ